MSDLVRILYAFCLHTQLNILLTHSSRSRSLYFLTDGDLYFYLNRKINFLENKMVAWTLYKQTFAKLNIT